MGRTIKRFVDHELLAEIDRWARHGDLGHLPPLVDAGWAPRFTGRGPIRLFAPGGWYPTPNLPEGYRTQVIRGTTLDCKMDFELAGLWTTVRSTGVPVGILPLPAKWAQVLSEEHLAAEARLRLDQAHYNRYLYLLKKKGEMAANTFLGVRSLQRMPSDHLMASPAAKEGSLLG